MRELLPIRTPWLVFVPVILGFFVRVVALQSLKETPYFDFLLWDERLYHDLAVKIADGTFASKAVYEFPPLPAYLTALLYRLFSPDVIYVRYMNILFGAGTCAVVYGIGTRIGGTGAGLLAGVMAAVYEPLVFYSVVPLKTSMGVFFFALTMFLFLRCLSRSGWGSLLFLGISAGLLLNVRPNALVMAPALPLILVWTFRKDPHAARRGVVVAGIFLAGFGMAVSPFVIRNLTVAGRCALTTTQAGFNLYLGNHLHSLDPYYRPVPFAVTSPSEQGVQFTIEASRRQNRRLSAHEASRYWTKEVLRIAFERPGAFFAKLFRKALVLFNRFEAGDHYDVEFLRKATGFLNIPLPGFSLVFPVGLAGLLLAVFRRSEQAVSLLVLMSLYGATLVVFFTNARYRLPLVVVLLPYGATGTLDILKRLKARDIPALVAACALIAGGVALESMPVRGTGDMTAYYNTHAVVLNTQGRHQEAIRYWEDSSAMEQGFSDFANLALAGMAISTRNTGEARRRLHRIGPGSFAEAGKLELMGEMAMGQRRFDAAADFYRGALSINAGLLVPRIRLIWILKTSGSAQAAEESEKVRYLERFYREAR